MRSIFEFGEKVDGYEVRVLNERAVRASAGILFFLAIIAFMNAWLMGNFQPTRVFVVAFLIDFSIRIFINPRYAPSLIVGQWVYSTGPQNLYQTPQIGTSEVAAPVDPAEAERCKVPDFAKAMGHEDKWKLHNNCK